jgi:hypothetical protein
VVDNSQGHFSYAEDALLVSQINVNPGRKQAHMQDGWYTDNGQKIIQSMIFAPNNPKNPNVAKGIKAVLVECGLYQEQLWGKCNKKCTLDLCCNRCILKL